MESATAMAANNGKPPGFFGVLRLTAQVLSRNPKHFLYLSAFLLAIPFALWLPFAPNSQTIADLVAGRFAAMNSTAISEEAYNPSHDIPSQQRPPNGQGLLFFLSLVFALSIGLVSTIALTVSVCKAYLNKDLCIKSSLRAVPDVFFRFLLTGVCLAAALTGVIIIIAGVIGLVVGFIVFLLRIGDPALAIIVATVVGLVGTVYFGILWSLAPIVTILEQKWGWEALSRSAYLVNGRKTVALCLKAFFHLCSIFLPFAISDEAPMLARFSVAALSVIPWTLLSLSSVASYAIFYLSCKDFHNESTDMLPSFTKPSFGKTSSAYTNLNSSPDETPFSNADS